MSDYCVEQAESIYEITEAVRKRMADGWQPLGGVAVMRYTYEDRKGYLEACRVYTQAMVKP